MKTAVKILIAAHSDEIINSFKKVLAGLKPYSFEISSALSYDNALEKLSSSDNYKFCFIFHDGSNIDGEKLIKATAKNNARRRFVFITAADAGDGGLMYLKAGACDHISVNDISPALIERIIRYNLPQAWCSERSGDQKCCSLIKDAPFGTIYHDRQGKIIFVNDESLKMFGHDSESEALKINVLTYEHLLESGISADLEKCMETGAEGVFERPYVSPRRDIYLKYKVKPVYDEDGKVTGAITVVENITDRKKVEAALIESEARFKNITHNSPIGINILNETGIIEYSNPAFCDLYGYSADEIIGKSFDMFLFEKDRSVVHMEFNKYISGREHGIPDEIETKARNGKTIVVMPNRIRIKENSGKTKSIVFIVDITDRKKMEQKLTSLNEFYLSIFEKFPAMIWRSGEDAKCNYVNKPWLEYTGMTMGQCIGDGWLESVHPNDRGAFSSNYINCFNERKPFEVQYRLRRHSGEYHWVANVGNPFIDINGFFSGFIGACFDITEQKKYEEQIKHLNENLERKVRERTKQLEAVNIELNATKEKLDEAFQKEKELNQLKTQFISTVSHDFRTPLSVILSSTELLEFYSDRLNEEKKKEHLHRIQDTVARMTNLLDDVLFINRVDSDRIKLNFVSINIVGLCSEICDEMRMVAGKKASVHFSANMMEYRVLADEKILRHILLNLISNAVKYSPEGGEVAVAIDISSDNGLVSYTISDHGIGIPEEEHKKLFEPFHRASNVGNIQGTGLGLSIVKRCVDLCGGTIELKSRPGEGTTFIVRMP